MVYRYSAKDFMLVGIALLQPIFFTVWCLYYDPSNSLLNLGLIFFGSLIFYFNPIVITHNFLHCPFFKNNTINKLFSIVNSANMIVPQILYKFHHLMHHTYSNDASSKTGVTKDPSSTYRYGKNGDHENMFSYCAFSLFRDGTTLAYCEVKKRKQVHLLTYQTLSVISIVALWSFINWEWLLFSMVPVFFFGWFLAHMENYYEHFAASDSKSRFANSVSFTSQKFTTN